MVRVYAQTPDCSRNLQMTCKKKSELANYRHDEERNYRCWNSLFLLSSSFSRIFDYDRFFRCHLQMDLISFLFLFVVVVLFAFHRTRSRRRCIRLTPSCVCVRLFERESYLSGLFIHTWLGKIVRRTHELNMSLSVVSLILVWKGDNESVCVCVCM